MKSWRTALLSLLLCCLPLVAGAAPRGHLVVVGGGATQEAIMRRAMELAGGPGVSLVILPQASSLADTGAKSAAMWQGYGATDVYAASDLKSQETRDRLAKAGLIWMPGGAQTDLIRALDEVGIREIVRQRYEDGAVVGGTSAGAAVMSSLMITGEADLQSLTPEATKLAAGLGLWPEVIVDQHFLKRQRFNRLLGAVLDHPDKLGVGIDEGTAVIVSPTGWEVVGVSSVLIIDARKATQGTDIRLHKLTAGMTWKP